MVIVALLVTGNCFAQIDPGICDSIINPDFTFTVNRAQVIFTNQSSTPQTGYNVTLTWIFGDGTQTNSVPSFQPGKQYSAPGTYTVMCIWYIQKAGTTFYCRDTVTKQVTTTDYPCSVNDAQYNITLNHRTATFTNTSTSNSQFAQTYNWDFGDSFGTSTQFSPVYTYPLDGTFSAWLRLKSVAVYDSTYVCHDSLRRVVNPKDWCATIDPSVTVWTVGAKVNASLQNNNFNYWRIKFDFGDPTTDADTLFRTQSPAGGSYTYSYDDTFNVTVNITAYKTGQDTCKLVLTRPVAIKEYGFCNSIASAFNYMVDNNTVSFNATSTWDTSYANKTVGYKWLFGDGTTAEGTALAHYYPYAGSFQVSLITYGVGLLNCADTTTATVQMQNITPPAAQSATNTIADGFFAPVNDYSFAQRHISDVINGFGNRTTIEMWYYYRPSSKRGELFKPHRNWTNRVEFYNYGEVMVCGPKMLDPNMTASTYCRQGLPPLGKCGWHHIAFEYAPDSFSVYTRINYYYDGVYKGALSPTISNDDMRYSWGELLPVIQGHTNVYLDELRISKDWRYDKQGFALPVDNFLNDSNTLALYHFSEELDSLSADGDTTFFYNSANNTHDFFSMSYEWFINSVLTRMPQIPRATSIDRIINTPNGQSNLDSVCPGDTIRFATLGLQLFVSPPGVLQMIDSASATVLLADTTVTVYAVIRDSTACFNLFDSVTLHIFPRPAADAGPDASVCYGDTAQLNASGGVLYRWVPNYFLSDFEIDMPLAYPPQTTWYHVLVTDSNGCRATDSMLLTILPLPQPILNSPATICFNDTAQLSATGGAHYAWSPDYFLSDTANSLTLAFPPQTKKYFVLVTDSNSCQATDSTLLTVVPLPQLALTAPAITCLGDTATVTATLYPTGTYTWQPTGLLPQPYTNKLFFGADTTLKVIASYSDTLGCKNTDSLQIAFVALPHLLAGTDTNLCGTNAQLLLNAASTANITWLGGYSNNTIVTIGAGTIFIASAIDSNGCEATDTLVVTTNTASASITGGDTTVCKGDTLTFNAIATSASWKSANMPTIATGLTYQLPVVSNDIVYVTAFDTNNCPLTDTFTIQVMPEVVWPGDANSDNVANNHDILAIGIAYGATGTARLNATVTWQAECVNSWADTFSTGKNYAHADCNGNGVVNADDTLAVVLNYGQIHAKTGTERSGPVPITITTNKPAYMAGDTVYGFIFLGDSSVTVDVYGIAYSFDAGTHVKQGTLLINQNNSWITAGANAPVYFERRNAYFMSQLAQTRTNHNNITGSGPIAAFSFVVDETVTNTVSSALNILDELALDKHGDTIFTNKQPYTIMLNAQSVGINQLTGDGLVFIYPNPASTYLNIFTNGQTIMRLRLYNAAGSLVTGHNTINANTIDIGLLPQGIYTAEIQLKDSVVKRRWVKM